MPWYWTDDLARVLVANDTISESHAETLKTLPFAIRRDERSIDEVALALTEDDEIPLAA